MDGAVFKLAVSFVMLLAPLLGQLEMPTLIG
jgi:hypothetical protein